jgi:hypothetical protein
MLIRSSGEICFSRRAAMSMLFGVVALAALVGPTAMRPTTVLAATDCRITDSLRMFPDVLKDATAFRASPQFPWRLGFTLNAPAVLMLCDQDFYCPGNRDHLVFRPSLSTNIDSGEPRTDNPFFPECKLLWDVDPVSNSGDIVFAFRTKYQVNGSLRRKSAQVTIHQAGYVLGTEMNISNTIVELDDGGQDG